MRGNKTIKSRQIWIYHLDQQVNSEPQKSESDSHMLGSRRNIDVRHSKKDLIRQKTFQLEKSSKGRTSKAKCDGVNLKDSSMPPEANPKTPVRMPQEKAKSIQKPQIITHSTPKTAEYYCAGIPYDESQGKYVAQDKKDEIILAAVSRVQSLQKVVQSWNYWANMTVEQATNELIPKQAELKTLRLERRETEKFTKEKQFLEENTILRLEAESSVLREKMEYAKEKGLQEAAKLEKALIREQEALNKCQSIGPEKDLLQDELTALKSKISALRKEMEKSKAVINQIEVQRAHEEREKMKFLTQVENIRKERERIENVAKAKEERTEENAKRELEKRKDKTTKMEKMMAKLKIKIEAGKKESLKREHRCVCMDREKSVVFLPCAHQRLCVNCDEILEKNGNTYCSFCVTLIQKRIKARFSTG